ncbi:Rcn1p Ecym_7368 [Eremothecium cymbalariae DBVPG|uniref:Calcipressin n=1 Tax=Eremothecium cymbalariae (strain CBS 270.75 / DBVPG 7215 / KCTC 17166 / NRRL Y-17582) TaxID=931890 RepID=G8JWH9_ERECY|nr:hypothetical protein Ecym_7368 [Eremothecium cymbalariae DBVPG\
MATDTILITSKSVDITDGHSVSLFTGFLEDHVLSKCMVTESSPIQVYVLSQLKRLVVVSPTQEISKLIMEEYKTIRHTVEEFQHYTVGYSLFDTSTHITRSSSNLEIPPAKRILLVSPPQSPPPGFDFHRLEDRPNSNTGHVTPGRAPASTSSNVSACDKVEPDKAFTILENSLVANVVLHTCETPKTEHTPSIMGVHTALPPRSIFD